MAAAAKSGKAVTEPTEAMKEIAHHDGLYRTFQDDNALSAFFQGFKRLLNDPVYTMGFAKNRPMREFGAGDFIIKYPRTPANLLARGLEYSPAGLLKTLWEASRPLMGREFISELCGKLFPCACRDHFRRGTGRSPAPVRDNHRRTG